MGDYAAITPGGRWRTRDKPYRMVTVKAVTKGTHNIPKGPTYWPADDDVHFTFDTGKESVCGITAFRRTYKRVSDANDS